MGRRLVRALCCALLAIGITVPAMAEDAPRSYKASPDIYKVINQDLRWKIHVIMATWKPGQRDTWHSHPAAGVYFLTDCQAQVYFADGTHANSVHKAGDAIVNPPIASHAVENTGSAECRLIIVEHD